MSKCKFCGKEQKHPLSYGYCVSCYQYFILHDFNIFQKSKYGQIDRVKDKKSKQYGMPICHICGKAYTKLQQHIWYSHNLERKEYCKMFGLDNSVNMTTEIYNKKMHDYALENNMDEQLRKVGVKTRFQKGHNNNYKRSEQTKRRLSKNGFQLGNNNKKGGK